MFVRVVFYCSEIERVSAMNKGGRVSLVWNDRPRGLHSRLNEPGSMVVHV